MTLAALPYYGPGTLGYRIPIYRSRNGGYSWEPLQQGAQYLAALANGDVYALHGTGVSRSQDDGDTWTPLSQAPGNGTALVATTGGTLLLATSDAGLYRSENDGLDWQPSGFPGQRIGAIVADADGSVHLGVDKNLYESTDDGVHWSPVATVPAAITALAHGADGLWWIGTRFIFFPPAGGVFAYDGVDVPSIAISATNVTDLAVRADGTVFAATAGYPDMECGEVLRSNGPGQPWIHTNLAGNVTALVLGDRDGVYAGTSYFGGHVGIYPGKGVWYTSGPGTQWFARNRGLVHAASPAVAVAPGVVYAQAGSRVSRSTDHGVTWTTANGEFDAVGVRLAGLTTEDVFLTSIPWVAAKADAPAEFALALRSHDGGDSWLSLTEVTYSPIVITAAGSVLGQSYAGVVRSIDGGKTWNPGSPGDLDAPLVDIEPGPVTRVFGTTGQATFVSEDDGQSWERIADVGGTQMAVSPGEQNVYVLAEGEPVHRLDEIASGTWSDATLPLGPYGPLVADAHGTLYLAADTVYRLGDGDAQWSPIPDTPALWNTDGIYPAGIESILFDEAGFLYVGTGNLGVLRSRLPVGSIATDTGRQPTITAWYAGANPTQGITAFALELTRDARVSLALYDVRGRVVSTLWSGATLGAGRHVASWRPDSQVASGTYFYRLDVGGALRSGRVTLVR